MGVDRDGQNPSGYLGLVTTQNPYLVVAQRDPTTLDRRYKIGTPWVNKALDRCFQLASAGSGSANWVLLGAAATQLDFLTGDSGGAITPVAQNINILGGTNLTSVGTAGTITLNLDASITLATSVTSPIYTSVGSMAINMPAGAFNMTVKLADAAGAQKLSFTNSSNAEIAKLDSLGALTVVKVDGILGSVTPAAVTGTTVVGNTSVSTGGDLIISAAAKKLTIKGGAVTDFIGEATLTAGTVTIANTNIATTDRIFISRRSINGSTALGMFTYTISAATSFTVRSVQQATPAATETNDVSIIEYVIIRQT